MTAPAPPRVRLPRLTASPFDGGGWLEAAPLGPFLLSHGGAAPRQPVRARVGADAHALYVRFECEDTDPWGTLRERDDPIYREEVVEVFLAPGLEDPRSYFEFEVSPLGVLFDARVENPDARRATMSVLPSWDCEGIRWGAGLAPGGWWGAFAIPWGPMLGGKPNPGAWRGNFYRIDRPRGGAPEHCAWSPTFADPPDFHLPARFGTLALPL